MKIWRMGHSVFRLLEHPIPVLADSLRNGMDLKSENGRVTHVDGVRSGRPTSGGVVMVAPDGAEITHPEHGRMELPPGAYAVEDVREARPEEERARRLRFETPAERTTALTTSQMD